MSRAKYKEVNANVRAQMAKDIKRAMMDANAGYVQELRYAQAYLRTDYPLFHFVSSKCQRFGVYFINRSEIEDITGIERESVDKLVDKLIDIGFLREAGEQYDANIITVDVTNIEVFKDMCDGLDERDIAKLRKLIGDKYFPNEYLKHKSSIVNGKKRSKPKDNDALIDPT